MESVRTPPSPPSQASLAKEASVKRHHSLIVKDSTLLVPAVCRRFTIKLKAPASSLSTVCEKLYAWSTNCLSTKAPKHQISHASIHQQNPAFLATSTYHADSTSAVEWLPPVKLFILLAAFCISSIPSWESRRLKDTPSAAHSWEKSVALRPSFA